MKVQTIKLKGPRYPFNASLQWHKKRKQFILVFREDLKGPDLSVPQGTRLGVAFLDRQFKQVGSCLYPPFPQFGPFVEDARLFWLGQDLYTLYYVYPEMRQVSPCLVKVDPRTFSPLSTALASTGLTPEKNWIPLIDERSHQSEIPVITRLFPLTLASFVRSAGGDLVPLVDKEKTVFPLLHPSHWQWGSISGGTHAVRLSNGYFLAFFHSWFLNDSLKRVYVMGAALLDKKYPHMPVKMSPFPILWKEMYDSQVNGLRGPVFSRVWATKLDRVIFPCGLVMKKLKSGKETVLVSCGENDNAIVIVQMDVEKLLSTLISI